MNFKHKELWNLSLACKTNILNLTDYNPDIRNYPSNILNHNWIPTPLNILGSVIDISKSMIQDLVFKLHKLNSYNDLEKSILKSVLK